MDFPQFQKSTQSPGPVYLLVTDQEYLKRRVRDHCLAQVEESARIFDWALFDLKKDSPQELLDVARTLPWMAEQRWIYVKNGDAQAEALVPYLKNPSARTVVILEVKKPLSSWPRLPIIRMSDRLDAWRWVAEKAEREGYRMDARTAQALVDLVGENLQLLSAELEKQFLWRLESREITLDSVMEMTFHVREYDVFALIDAIASRRSAVALRVLNRLYDAGMSGPHVVSMLYWSFRRLLVAREMLDRGISFRSLISELKIWSYRDKEKEVRKYSRRAMADLLIRLCQTDRLLKTTGTDSKTHLERLVIDTCRARFL